MAQHVEQQQANEMQITVPPKLELVMLDGPCEGQTLAPKGFCLTIGRTRASKLNLKDPSVSEKHGEICWDGQSWLLRDNGSSNGTLYKGRKLLPKVEQVPLQDGDEVLFGMESKGRIVLTHQGLEDITLEQLLLSQYEALSQSLEKHALGEAKAMMTEWTAAKEGLLGSLPRPMQEV